MFSEGGFIKQPGSTAEWRNIARECEKYWNFPNCVGTIDGKHVSIQCPARGGSMYFNYKKFHSIVLLAVLNAQYEFSMFDIGDYGRLSDSSVYATSYLGKAKNQISFPLQENWLVKFPQNILMSSLGMKFSHYVGNF